MKQSRRVSPRIAYDEAVCLARVDGAGRLFGRSIDLGPAGIYVTCSELCEIGTELVCAVLLPGGPRRLRGRVVRLVALPRAVGIAIAFTDLREADRVVIERLVASRAPEAQAVKLRVGGLDHDLRCEAVIDKGERTMRVSTALPAFLRLDADVGVVMNGSDDLNSPGALKKRGVIRRIAVDPAPRDGVPRLALDVDLAASGLGPEPRPPEESEVDERAPPSGLPRPYRHPLPSVLLSRGFAREAASEAPSAAAPRRRKHGTAEIARRFTSASARVFAVPGGDLTEPVTMAMTPLAARHLSVAWLAIPIMMAATVLALLSRLAH